MSDNLCVVCRHRPPARGYVCEADRERITAQLAELPRRLADLTLQLVPSAAGIRADRVSTTRVGSPTGARLDALTLLGPGADGLSEEAVAAMMHPVIRRWRTIHRYTITVEMNGQTRDVERELVEWHQEAETHPDGRPVLAAADDQTGLLPPAEWLDSWARSWRKHFGHHVPPLLRARGYGKDTASARVTAGALALHAQRQHDINVVLGLTLGHGGAPVLRTDDPIAEEWEIRYGEPTADRAVQRNVAYLLAWFDYAAAADVGIADFAAELRSVTAELVRVLGEQPDQQWLGRCPSKLTDQTTGDTHRCGAGLWQDPFASQVQCPRCRSTWGQKKVELIHLAAEIRKVWPIDRRRRYTTDEASQAVDGSLTCPGCGEYVDIAWREVTAPTERERWWRPERAVCPRGCTEAERVI